MEQASESEAYESTDPVHEWFGLSYSNYLVLHRTLLQSMPIEWQRRFVGMVEELSAAFRHIEHPVGFKVQAAHECEVRHLTPAEAVGAGIDVVGGGTGDDEADDVDHYYDEQGRELDDDARVMVPCPDPIPHYQRGRARVEPKFG